VNMTSKLPPSEFQARSSLHCPLDDIPGVHAAKVTLVLF
jgi:hypothetical protein